MVCPSVKVAHKLEDTFSFNVVGEVRPIFYPVLGTSQVTAIRLSLLCL